MMSFKNKAGLEKPEFDIDRSLQQVEQSDLVKLLQQSHAQLEPRAEFTRLLEQKLRLPAIPPKPSQFWRSTTFRLTVLGVILLGAVALFGLVFLPTQSVNAAEIMVRAAQSTNNPIAFGLQSYHGNLGLEGRNNASDPLDQKQEEIWFKGPKSFRSESRQPQPNGQNQLVVVQGSDGLNAWSYIPAQNLYTLLDPNPTNNNITYRNTLLGATSLTDVLQAANTYYEARLAAAETIVGRAVYVIEFTPRPGTQDYAPLKKAAHMKFWIDQQNYLQLGIEYRDAQNQLLFLARYTSLELNLALDSSLFRFVQPAGATIIDQRPLSVSEVDRAWKQAAAQVPYKIFRPSFVPEGYTPSNPQFQTPRSGVLNANYGAGQGNIYNYNALTIMEAPTGTWKVQGEKLMIGQVAAIYLKEKDGYLHHVFFELEGTAISVTSEMELTKAQLIQIAESLQPVTK